MKQTVTETLSVQRAEPRKAIAGGEYLPLNVYATRGFDVAAIEQHCKDWKPSEMFGRVFKVLIEGSADKTEEMTFQQKSRQQVSGTELPRIRP